MFSKGVSRRWMVNTTGVVFFILVVSITTLSLMVQSSTYNGIELSLAGRADELLNWLSYQRGPVQLLQLFRHCAGLYRGLSGQEQHGDYGPRPKRPGVHHLHRL